MSKYAVPWCFRFQNRYDWYKHTVHLTITYWGWVVYICISVFFKYFSQATVCRRLLPNYHINESLFIPIGDLTRKVSEIWSQKQVIAFLKMRSYISRIRIICTSDSNNGCSKTRTYPSIQAFPTMSRIVYKCKVYRTYRQTSNISRTWVGNKIVGHSDAVGASPVACKTWRHSL